MVGMLAALAFTGLGTWWVHDTIARVDPTAATVVVWLGLASMAFEVALGAWSIRILARLDARQTRLRMQFLASAVHDVRQPLQAAALFVDHLLHPNPGPHSLKAVKSLDMSLQAVRHTLDCLLDTARLDADAVMVQRQTFSLLGLLHAAETEFMPRAHAMGLRFCLFCPSRDATLHSDPQLVSQIVRNLLAHASAHAQRGGFLLGVRQSGGAVRIQVWHCRAETGAVPHEKPDPGMRVAHRLAALIQAPLTVQSRPGGGVVSTLTLERATALPSGARSEA